MLTDRARASLKEALEGCGEIRDGAHERCQFVEIYSPKEDRCVTLDIDTLEACDDATIALWIAAIQASLVKKAEI